jgi:hypothetical protein
MSGMSKMGGNETNAFFCRPPEIQNFFLGCVDDATSALDGQGMAA